nr:MAG TPA: hypothetical protein [Bacteriophage sp.]
MRVSGVMLTFANVIRNGSKISEFATFHFM